MKTPFIFLVVISIVTIGTSNGQNAPIPDPYALDVSSLVEELCADDLQIPATDGRPSFRKSLTTIADVVQSAVRVEEDLIAEASQLFWEFNNDAVVRKVSGLVVSEMIKSCPTLRDELVASFGETSESSREALGFVAAKIASTFASDIEYVTLTSAQRHELIDNANDWAEPFIGGDETKRAEFLAYMAANSEGYTSFVTRQAVEDILSGEIHIRAESIDGLISGVAKIADVESIASSSVELWEEIIQFMEQSGYTMNTNEVSQMNSNFGFASDLIQYYEGDLMIFILFVEKHFFVLPFVTIQDEDGNLKISRNFFARMSEFEDDKYKILAGKFTIPQSGRMRIMVGHDGSTITGRLLVFEKE